MFLLPAILFLSIVSRGVLNVAGALTLFDVILFVLAGDLLARNILKGRSFSISKEGAALIVLLALIVFTEIIGFMKFSDLFVLVSLKPALQFIEYLLVFWCVMQIVRKREDIRKYVNLEVTCGMVLAIIIIYESYFGVFLLGEQAVFMSTFSDYRMELKINPSLMLLLVPTFWLLVFHPKKNALIYTAILVLMFALVISSSRSLYLAVLGGLAGIVFFRQFKKAFVVLGVGALFVWLKIDFVAPKVMEIVSSVLLYTDNPFADSGLSSFGRVILWNTTIPSMVMSHPFWGYGINGFGMELFTDFGGINPAGDAHNQYLQVIVDHGIIAFVLFAYLYFSTMRICFGLYKRSDDIFDRATAQALFISLFSFLFAFVGVVLIETDNSILPVMFWFNLGIIYSMKRRLDMEQAL